MLRRAGRGLTLMTLLLWCTAAIGSAQECNDFNDCTVDDMCSNGGCGGTPALGGSCEAAGPLVNGICVASESGASCMGEQPPIGASCERGCGTLQLRFPGLPGTICVASEGIEEQPCPDIDPEQRCVSGVCERQGPFNEARCRVQIPECPDVDGNPCTREDCSNETGECMAYPACAPDCETCNPSTGECTPANLDTACEDNNPCTPESTCQAVDIPGYRLIGLCRAPASTLPTATPTVPPNTPTPTLEPRCVGDCDSDNLVRVNELIIGVNIALERAPFLACVAFDESANRRVEVNELVRGVNSLLIGCGPAQ